MALVGSLGTVNGGPLLGGTCAIACSIAYAACIAGGAPVTAMVAAGPCTIAYTACLQGIKILIDVNNYLKSIYILCI